MTKNKIGITARIAITAMLWMSFPGTVLADGGDDGYSATADGYRISLVFAEPAETGANEFHIQITDSMGRPVSNAEVEVTAMPVEAMSTHEEEPVEEVHGMEMPAEAPAAGEMEGMSGMDMSSESVPTGADMNSHDGAEVDAHTEEPIKVSLTPGHEPGEYSGEITLDASGDWIFNVHFTIGGQMTEVEMPVEVPRAISNYGILAGFFGVNATVIASAAIMRRKPILK